MPLQPVPGYYWHLLSRSYPGSLEGAASAWDPASSLIVLFGGTPRPVGAVVAETWTWDGSLWTKQAPASSPTARDGHAMAYYPGTGVVLFGGRNGVSFPIDTWVWQDFTLTWQQVVTAHAPTGRTGHSMTYDPVTNQVILFGGANSVATAQTDTWVFNGADWTQLTPATTPTTGGVDATINAQLGLASTGKARLVLRTSGGVPANSVFDWTGTDWSLLGTASVNIGGSLAYHSETGRSVLLGSGLVSPFGQIVLAAAESALTSPVYRIVVPRNITGPVATPGTNGGPLFTPDIDGRITYVALNNGGTPGTYQLRTLSPQLDIGYATGGYGT